MISVRRHEDGIVVPVRVQPGAPADRIGGEHAGRLRVRTTAPPEKGKANESVGRLLAKALGRKARDVELLAGATSRDKEFLVRGATTEEIVLRLRNICAERASVAEEQHPDIG